LKYLFSVIILLSFSYCLSYAQSEEPPIDRWDTWLILGNKFVLGGKENFRHSHELQWRVNDNMRQLKEWFYEGVFTYSPNSKWEFVPDFRASVKPERYDFRFGLGTVHKSNFYSSESKLSSQFVKQFKYQLDIDSRGNVRQGIRLVLTYNYIVSEHILIGGLIGPFYRWSDSFTGIEFIRGGGVFTYVFDPSHTLSFAPLFGAGNIKPNGWSYSFTPMFSLIIRINKDYKYVPAKYINF